MVDKDGKLVKDEFEEHLLSLDLEEFKKIPIRVGVAYGLDKKEAILRSTSRWLCECTDHRRESCELPDRRNKITIKIKSQRISFFGIFLRKA